MSDRYLGGFITTVPPDPDPALGSAASGMWTMEQYFALQKQGKWPTSDPYFNQTVLSLHGNGTNGAQNNTFLDSGTANSGSGFTITRNPATGPNAPTQGTFSPFSAPDGRWSNFFDGNTDYLRLGSAGASSFSTNNFTIECWIYSKALGDRCLYDSRNTSTGQPNHILWTTNTSGQLVCYSGNTFRGTSTGTFFANTWNHVALVREGTGTNQTKFYINGVLAGTFTLSDNLSDGTNPVIGAVTYTPLGAASWNGYISNFRIVKGRAVYTSAFTPSTVPLGATSGGQNPPQGTETSLLTCQSNRFVDNSTNNFAITINEDVKVTPFIPFAPTAAYSPSVNGGSGYFDGTSDWLNVGPLGDTAFNFGTGAFTIEGWIYPLAALSASTYSAICAVHDGFTTTSWGIYARSNGIFMYGAGNVFVGGGTINPNTFTHFAVTRSGNTVTVYVNGEQVAQNTGITGAYDNSGDQLKIGDDAGTAATWNGYIASLRIIKGQSLTTGAFTPPTAPVTTSAVGWTGANAAASITGTVSLLLNFTNAGIFDNTGKNNLETVGNAQIDTTTKKYGTGSMEGDGSGDYLLLPASPNLEFGSGDFTIEFWWYPTSTIRQALYHGSFGADWSIGIDYSSVGTNQKIGIWASSNGTSWNLINADGGGNGIGTTTVTQNAWNHIAYVRNGTTWMLFVNGNRDLNLTGISGSIVNRSTYQKAIAVWWSSGSMAQMVGYIDDLRITKGVARYTSNFTPQTSQWQDQ